MDFLSIKLAIKKTLYAIPNQVFQKIQGLNIEAGNINCDSTINTANINASIAHIHDLDSKILSVNINGVPNIVQNNAIAAIGEAACAQSPGAVAIGRYTIVSANADDAIAIGNEAAAGAPGALALSPNASAVAQNAVAIGHGAGANGPEAMALGCGAEADLDYAVAVGHNAQASAIDAIAAGAGASAGGDNSAALGWNAGAYGAGAVAAGHNAMSCGMDSVAIGAGAGAYGDRSNAFGCNNSALAGGSMVLGNGFDENNQLANNTPDALVMAARASAPLIAMLPASQSGGRGKFGVGVDPDDARFASISDGGAIVAGDLYHAGGSAGFFGAAPVAQPAAITGATTDERLNDLIAKLTSLGLLAPPA